MKGKLLSISTVFVTLMLISSIGVGSCGTSTIPKRDDALIDCTYDLWAGQTILVGEVGVWMTEDDKGKSHLWVTVEVTKSGWKIDELHIEVVKDLSKVPTAGRHKNPIPGKFDFKKENIGKTSITVEVKLPNGVNYDTISCGDLYIMVHAVVYKGNPSTRCTYREETAWGGDNDFDSKKWAYYIVFPCCKDPTFSPTADITIDAVYPGSPTYGSGDCYWDVTFDGLNYDSKYLWEDMDALSWCFEKDDTMSGGKKTNVKLYSSYSSSIPTDEGWDEIEWDRINWIINHKDDYTVVEVQEAIWYTVNSNWGTNNQLAQDAATYGDGFHPGGGQVMAIIIDTHQGIFFEIDP